MGRKYDPRAPRPNPEIPDIMRAMRQTWQDLRQAADHRRRRGFALVLRAHLDAFLEEPEQIYDLEPGAVESLDPPAPPGGEGAPAYLDEGLFDRPGRDKGKYFYYTYSGRTTPLFQEPGDPYYPFNLSGYWVLLMEKIYASKTETQNRLTSEEAFHRSCPQAKKSIIGDGPRFVIFMDPKGIYDGRSTRRAGVVGSEAAAIKAANRLDELLGIRFVAARLQARIDTH